VTLGINRTKLAIVLALAHLGGTARTSDIARVIDHQDQPIRSTLLRHLRDLEKAGYVTTEQPTNPKGGAHATWKLHPETINTDLTTLMARWTPQQRAEQAPAST
jgi:predicted transcriptional regulator